MKEEIQVEVRMKDIKDMLVKDKGSKKPKKLKDPHKKSKEINQETRCLLVLVLHEDKNPKKMLQLQKWLERQKKRKLKKNQDL